MKAASLIRWSNLEDRRRRQSMGGFAALPEMLVAVLWGAILAAELVRRLALVSDKDLVASASASSQLWVAAAVCAFAIAVFGAPFRLYWRRDSKLLASLPVPGTSLFALALWRSHRSALQVSLALLVALVPMGVFVDWQWALRHLLAVGIGFLGAAWLGPAAALGAGAIVASDKAQAMIASMGGEFQAPRTSWLGILPGLAATALTVALMACAPWIAGGRPPGGSILMIALLALGVSAIALLWAWTRAASVIPAAVREVAALDQEILAHVERSTPSKIERAAIALLRSPRSRWVAVKDAALLRRRYPSPYFVIPCGIIAIWIVAASQPLSYLPWAGSFLGAILVYAILMARRAQSEPVEIPRLISTLAIRRGEVAGAKNLLSSLRIALIALTAGPLLIARAPDPLSAAIFVLLASALSWLAARTR